MNEPPTSQGAPLPSYPVTSTSNTTDQNSHLPGIPETWPGPFGVYKYSKAAIKFNLNTALVVFACYVVLFIVENVFRSIRGLAAIGSLLQLVDIVLTTSYVIVSLAGVRRQTIKFGEALQQSFQYFLKMFVLSILLVLSFAISCLLFAVPFFFVFPRLILAPYYLIDQKLGIIESYKASWHATKGNVLKIWGMVGLTLLMAVLIITIIGIPFSIYLLFMYYAAYAVFYEYLNKNQPHSAAMH